MQQRPDWQTVSESEWEAARAREKLIRPLAESGTHNISDVDAAAASLGLSRSFTYKLLANYKQQPKTSSLLLAKRGRPADSRALDLEREEVIETAIQEFYLRRERPRLADLMREVAQLCDKRNLKTPNYRTLLKRVRAIDARLAAKRRLGSKAADAKFKPVAISPFKSLKPLEFVQIDHTPVDVVVVDEQLRLPIGRPWLTLAIDVSSRVITGLSVSLRPPSTVSVARVLAHAVFPKEDWLAERSVDLDWPVAGLPSTLHLDNAKEFESAALVRACQEYGIELKHRPPGRPHFGGHIERLIGTVMGAVHILPGSTFSNIRDKGDYDSTREAVLTLTELERWLALQIAGVYHQSIHSSLGKPPIDVWRQALQQRKQPARMPANAEQFFIEFLPGQQRILQRDGIRLYNIRYWDNILSPLVGRLKEPVMVKYDPRNLSRIYFRDEGGHYWPIPYLDLGLPPISLWELQEARRRLAEEGRRAVDEKTIFQAIREQRRIVEQASARKPRKGDDAKIMSGPETNVSRDQKLDPGEVRPFEVEELS
jgi:putative transposase